MQHDNLELFVKKSGDHLAGVACAHDTLMNVMKQHDSCISEISKLNGQVGAICSELKNVAALPCQLDQVLSMPLHLEKVMGTLGGYVDQLKDHGTRIREIAKAVAHLPDASSAVRQPSKNSASTVQLGKQMEALQVTIDNYKMLLSSAVTLLTGIAYKLDDEGFAESRHAGGIGSGRGGMPRR